MTDRVQQALCFIAHMSIVLNLAGEWKGDRQRWSKQETIRAVVETYAEGKIVLPPIPSQARGLRSAPSFLILSAGHSADKPYTAPSLAAFIGWGEDKVKNILAALEEIERGALREQDFTGLGSEQATKLTMAVRAVERTASTATASPRAAAFTTVFARS